MKKFIEMPKDRKDLDGKEDFSLVEIKGTPHCKKHGAMNMYKKIWRCYSKYGRAARKEGETIGKFIDRVCNACCLEVEEEICECEHFKCSHNKSKIRENNNSCNVDFCDCKKFVVHAVSEGGEK